jgi:hypothetical protein
VRSDGDRDVDESGSNAEISGLKENKTTILKIPERKQTTIVLNN